MKVTKELCPVEYFTEMLGGKWKLLIINTIKKKGLLDLDN